MKEPGKVDKFLVHSRFSPLLQKLGHRTIEVMSPNFTYGDECYFTQIFHFVGDNPEKLRRTFLQTLLQAICFNSESRIVQGAHHPNGEPIRLSSGFLHPKISSIYAREADYKKILPNHIHIKPIKLHGRKIGLCVSIDDCALAYLTHRQANIFQLDDGRTVIVGEYCLVFKNYTNHLRVEFST